MWNLHNVRESVKKRKKEKKYNYRTIIVIIELYLKNVILYIQYIILYITVIFHLLLQANVIQLDIYRDILQCMTCTDTSPPEIH